MRSISQIRSGLRRRVLRIRNRHPEPFATHIPVLLALGRVVPVGAVLELGSGPFSTGLFLSGQNFPNLSRLVSYEDDAAWASRIQGECVDERLDYRLVDSVPDAVGGLDLTEFDLVFIDDSKTIEERQRSISIVNHGRHESQLIAIHDFETPEYRRAVKMWRNGGVIIFGAITPQVGVICGDPELRQRIMRAKAVIAEGLRLGIDPTDAINWADYLDAELKFDD